MMKRTQNISPDEFKPSIQWYDLYVILFLGFVVLFIAGKYDVFENLVALSRKYEGVELDEIITLFIYFSFALAFFSFRRCQEARKIRKRLIVQNNELREALSEIKQLKGILPICAECKQIRDDKGYWHQVEAYVREHSDAVFSHGLCPDCMKKLYPEFVHDDDKFIKKN